MSGTADLETRVVDLIRRELHATMHEIDAQTRFVDDLGADSITLVELTIVFEETFDIEMSDEEANKIRTVRDAIAAIKKCVQAQHCG